MRDGACAALSIMAVMLGGCAPQTVPAMETEPSGDQAGASGAMGSGSVASTVRPEAASSAAPIVVHPAPPPAAATASSALPNSAPASAANEPAMSMGAMGEPLSAIAYIDPLSHAPLAMPAAGAAAAAPSSAGSTARQLPAVPEVNPALCQRLEAIKAAGRVGSEPRLQALLSACESQGGAGSAAGASGASAMRADSTAGELTGSAVFTASGDETSLLLVLQHCKDGALYPVRIHEGNSCADRGKLGPRWDGTRGEDIPDLQCKGSRVSEMYSRARTSSQAWTVGDGSHSDVMGHTIIIGDPMDRTLPIACGVIVAP